MAISVQIWFLQRKAGIDAGLEFAVNTVGPYRLIPSSTEYFMLSQILRVGVAFGTTHICWAMHLTETGLPRMSASFGSLNAAPPLAPIMGN